MRDGWNCTRRPYSSVIDTTSLRRTAVTAGAAAFGITTAATFVEARDALLHHRSQGTSGPLHFTYDDPETATDISISFPWAASLVVIGVEYASQADSPASTGPLVARFATSDHYELVRIVVGKVAGALEASGARAEVVFDDNRLVDRAAAARAGVGWIGKSTMVLAPGVGPWMLLGTVVTDAALVPTPTTRRSCGSCVACMPACPTTAITDAGLDARRCLSTWLQTSGFLPLWIRPLIGRRIYGCDDCLSSCPPGFKIKREEHGEELSFVELLALADDDLVARFSWWFIPHRDGRYLRRNLLVAAGNSCEEEALKPIEEHLHHRSSMIRSHAAWALARQRPAWADATLRAALGRERAPEARQELAIALTMLGAERDYEALLAADELARTAS